jgi:hypothetical protein
VIITSSSLASAAPNLNIENQDLTEVPVTVPEPLSVVSPTESPIEVPKVKEPVVEPVPVVTPAVKVPQPTVHPIGCENYRQLVSQYEWNVEVALKVMRAESGCNPSAIGDQYTIRGLYAPSCGLFQIRTLQGRPTCEQLQNPATNIEWAIKLYRASGWQPWSVCKNGKVSCY